MADAVHHYLKRKRAGKEKGKEVAPILDKIIYISAFTGPFFMLPQAIKIFTDKNASGLSIYYWYAVLTSALLWGFYGLVHREKPIVVANFLSLAFIAVIIAGILIYG